MWVLLGSYNTGERLYKMKKARTPNCNLCSGVSGHAQVENLTHFLLSCSGLSDIRENFLSQFISLSPSLIKYMEASPSFLICLIDPYSSLVPSEVRRSWVSEQDIYETSRNFVYAMHNQRTKLMELLKITV